MASSVASVFREYLRDRAIEQAPGIFGRKADRLVVIGNRLVVIRLVAPGESAIVKKGRVRGFSPDCAGVIFDGLIVFLLVAATNAAVEIVPGILRVQAD